MGLTCISYYLTNKECDFVKTLVGCCLIHLGIGSIYSLSVLYPLISRVTGWETALLIQGFSIIILLLGLTASLHQVFLKTVRKKSVLFYGVLLWTCSQFFLLRIVRYYPSFSEGYCLLCIPLGISLGLLYVIPINIVTNYGYKRVGVCSGLVVCCFGLGSIIAAPIFSSVSLDNLPIVYALYSTMMYIGLTLIEDNGKITSPTNFNRNKLFYWLALVFFFNIGIGISLLANLLNLSVERGLSSEVAVGLVAMAGVANTLGRLGYASVSDYYGKMKVLVTLLVLQVIALGLMRAGVIWNSGVIAVISVYGGVFAIMPSLMKKLYNTTTAYSQILIMWGIAGLIFPSLFSFLGFNLLLGVGIVIAVIMTLIAYFLKESGRNI